MTDIYTPKPWHLLLPVVLFGAGAWCMKSTEIFVVVVGVMLWVVAWIIIGWVIYADISSRRIRYLETVADAIEAANKSDLDKLAALGFSSTSIEQKTSIELTDKRDGLNNTYYFDLPVSAVKLQPLARGVLNGQPFSRRRWAELLTDTEFRSLHGVFRDRGFLVPVSDKDQRQGFTFTSDGRQFLEKIAGTNSMVV
jgi:hypothetical protein